MLRLHPVYNFIGEVFPLRVLAPDQLLLPLPGFSFDVSFPFKGSFNGVVALIVNRFIYIVSCCETAWIAFRLMLPNPCAQIGGHARIEGGVVLVGNQINPGYRLHEVKIVLIPNPERHANTKS
jgi:hypothetical protein